MCEIPKQLVFILVIYSQILSALPTMPLYPHIAYLVIFVKFTPNWLIIPFQSVFKLFKAETMQGELRVFTLFLAACHCKKKPGDTFCY